MAGEQRLIRQPAPMVLAMILAPGIVSPEAPR